MTYNINVNWYSEKQHKVLTAFANDLDYALFSKLQFQIFNHGDWKDLKNVIRSQEGEFTYLVRNSNYVRAKQTLVIDIIVSTASKPQ